MLAAIVLAAGESSRMGVPKALLRDQEGLPFVTRIVRAFLGAGVFDVAVVTGSHHSTIVETVAVERLPSSVRVVRNADPSRGQLSSLWAGMDAVVRDDTRGILMTLVDVPLISAAIIERVVHVWRDTGAPIVRPAIGERHGHPVLFDAALFHDLRHAPLEAGAKAVIRSHTDEIVNVPVEDAGCLVDLDTPADYERHIRRPFRPRGDRS